VNTGKIIRKVLFVALWVAIGGGMLMLLIAAIGKQKRDQCKDYTIRIKGTQKNLFVDDKSIVRILELAGNGKIKGQKRSSFNLLEIEKLLKNNVWIKEAELYFDNHNVLHVSVTEREPIARVFTVTGKSFYVDDSGKMMPLSDKLSARVPVFTGFPAKVISKRDSILLNEVRSTSSFILHDPFWMSQVAQIDITPERNFEMIPMVGNHTVLFGDGENMEQKFHRLFVFYKNVLSQTGFDKYKAINVQYAGQIIGVKNNSGSKTDTVQLRLNVEKLLRQAREVQNDSLVAAREIKEQKTIQVDPAIAATEKSADGDKNKEPKAGSFTDPVLVTNPVSMKHLSGKKDEQAKAVMPKKE
jgi:cell division protein FtsQ